MKKAAIVVAAALLLSAVLSGCCIRCPDPYGPVCGEPCNVDCMRKQYVCK